MKKIIFALLLCIPLLVKGEELLPDLGEEPIEIITYEKKSFRDINNILYMYEIEKTYLVDATINGFFLDVKAGDYSGKGFILLQSRIDGNIKKQINIKVLGGKIKIKIPNTLDCTGMRFNVYNNNDLIDTIVVNSDNIGYSKHLISNLYRVEQVDVLKGYQRLNPVEVQISHTGIDYIFYTFKKVQINLKITKTYNQELEDNIYFDIYQNNDVIKNCKTSMGVCTFTLEYGEYIIKQRNSLHDEELYQINLKVDENTNINYEIIVNNDSPKTEINLSKEELVNEEESKNLKDKELPSSEVANNNEKDIKIIEQNETIDSKEELLSLQPKEITNLNNPKTKDPIILYLTISIVSLFIIIKKVKA